MDLYDEYNKFIAREKRREQEMGLVKIRRRQTVKILLALCKYDIPIEEVVADWYVSSFPYCGMQVYLQNQITRMKAKIHRLPQSDAEESSVQKYRPLILSQEEGVPDNFRECFQYHQFIFSGEPDLAVAKVLNKVVLIKAHPLS